MVMRDGEVCSMQFPTSFEVRGKVEVIASDGSLTGEPGFSFRIASVDHYIDGVKVTDEEWKTMNDEFAIKQYASVANVKTWEERCLELVDTLRQAENGHALQPGRAWAIVYNILDELEDLIRNSPADNRMRMVRPR